MVCSRQAHRTILPHTLYMQNYIELQMLQQRFGAQGFQVLAFPCNQFNKQEPGRLRKSHRVLLAILGQLRETQECRHLTALGKAWII